ncbi:MAG: 50S ribosomal protein L6 [Chloroflexi bacterium]|nr:50S ribosomal protein L6 [Chloroflexota bacterium]
MSRIGRKPIPLPQGVNVDIRGSEVVVKGPKGELRRTLHADMSIARQDGQLVVNRPSDSKLHKSLHGLTRTLVANMVDGVSKGFEKNLELSGVGYRVQKTGDKIALQVGYTHAKEFVPPAGITLLVEGTNKIKVQGTDKELVGQVAAHLKEIRVPDAYKGKGIRYANERIHLKPGKAGKATAKKK